MSFKSRPPLIVSQSALTIIAGKTCLLSINASNQHYFLVQLLDKLSSMLEEELGQLDQFSKVSAKIISRIAITKMIKIF